MEGQAPERSRRVFALHSALPRSPFSSNAGFIPVLRHPAVDRSLSFSERWLVPTFWLSPGHMPFLFLWVRRRTTCVYPASLFPLSAIEDVRLHPGCVVDLHAVRPKLAVTRCGWICCHGVQLAEVLRQATASSVVAKLAGPFAQPSLVVPGSTECVDATC